MRKIIQIHRLMQFGLFFFLAANTFAGMSNGGDTPLTYRSHSWRIADKQVPVCAISVRDPNSKRGSKIAT